MGAVAWRWRDVPRLAATVAGAALLLGVLWAAKPVLGSVSFAHPGRWVASTPPAEAVTALARLGGMVLAGWLLVSTLVYLAAVVAGAEGLVRRTRWVTLPVVRRMVEGVAAASIVASTVTAAAAGAVAAGRPTPNGHVAVARPDQRLARVPDGRAANGKTPVSGAPVTVNDRLVGRHLPHPGVLSHAVLASYTVPAALPRSGQPVGIAGLAPGTKYVVVQPGDCLSVIAQEHLGNWQLDWQIHHLNVGRTQPDGRALTDDHWIYPGWVLVMPADATNTQVVPQPSLAPPAATSPSVSTSPSVTPTEPTPSTAPTPSTKPASPPATVPHQATPKTSRPPQTHTRSASTSPARPSGEPGGGNSTHTGRRVPAAPVAGVAGLVAAGVIWRIGRRRRDQMHRRRSGRRPTANPAPVTAAEAQARVIADTEALRWVDAGLRYLGGQLAGWQHHGQSGNPDVGPAIAGERPAEDERPVQDPVVPSVVLVRAGARGLEVMISPPQLHPPQGWHATDEGSVWVLDTDIDLDGLEERAGERWSFLPALVTVGATADGTVLANLEHAGSLAVEGDADIVQAVVAQIMIELTSQPWADEMLAGLHALGDPGGRHLAGVDDTGDPMGLAERLDATAERTAASMNGSRSAAARRVVDGEPLPHVVVAFADSDPEAVRCLVEAALPDRSGVAVVAAGASVEARWRLTVDDGGAAVLAGAAGDHPFQLGLQVSARAEVIDLLGQALTAAAGPADTPAMPGDPAAADGERVGTGSPPTAPRERGLAELRLLGTVRVVGDAGRVEAARRDAPLAVLAYLVTHRGPTGSADLAGALWPVDSSKDRFGQPAAKTVQNVVSRARTLAGADGGEQRLRLQHGAYVLADSFTTDWQRFEATVAAAAGSPPGEATSLYRQALDLVDGAPFGGVLDSPFFEWVSAEQLNWTMTAAIVDAAEEMARLALDADDYDAAIWAVQKGLSVDPAREELYQCWMHALGRSVGAKQVAGVWQRLCAALQAHIDPTQDPSPDSQAVYRSYVARQDSRL